MPAVNIYREMLLSASPSLAMFFGDTSASKTIDVVGGSVATWASAPTVVAPAGITVSDPLGIGYVDTTNYPKADITPSGGQVSGVYGTNVAIEMVLSVLSYPVAPSGDEAFIPYIIGNNSSYAMYAAFGNSATFPKKVAFSTMGQKFTSLQTYDLNKIMHVVINRDLNGLMTGYINGVKQGSISTSGSLNTAQYLNYLQVTNSYSGQFRLYAIADFARSVTDAEVAERYAAITNAYKLSGRATLDNGSSATVVAIRRASDKQNLKVITPDTDGSWLCYVPSGDYEVTAFGPSGYRPVCDYPVTAIAA